MDRTAAANRLISYHADITSVMNAERTNLESGLIPVSAYIVVACLESFWRWPDMIQRIDATMPAEEIGRRGRRPGVQVNPVYLWSLPNFYLIGRKALASFGTPVDDGDGPERTWRVLDFWERAARAWRGDGKLQAWDAGMEATPYGPEALGPLMESVRPVGDAGGIDAVRRFSASLMSYLFLLYFDTRVGTGDTGPYPLPDGRILLVRDFYRLSRSDFWWSDVAAEVPYRNLTAALVFDPDVQIRVDDWGTTRAEPSDYLEHLVGFGLCTTDDQPPGGLRPVGLGELDGIVAAVRSAQSRHYRQVAAMEKAEKVRCGAYVYFTFLRPFAVEAGVADELDWSVPVATAGPVWDMCLTIEGGNAPPADDGPYFQPIG